MGTAGRKARKRAREQFVHPVKTPTGPRSCGGIGLGLVTGAEILAAIVIADLFRKGSRR